MKKREKVKREYTVFSNIRFSFATYWKYRKSAVIFCVIGTFMRVAVPFLGIYLPKAVIESLTSKVPPTEFVINIGSIVLLLAALTFVMKYTNQIINAAFGTYGSYLFCVKGFDKRTSMDYELMENPEFKKIEDKAARAAGNNHTPAMNLPRNLSNVVVNALGFLLYGGVIAYVSPWIICLLILSALINWAVLSSARKFEKSKRETISATDRKLWYIVRNARNLHFAKDIRLYSMRGFLSGIFDIHTSERQKTQTEIENRNTGAKITDILLILVRDGAAYAYLIYLLINNRLSLGDFVLIFAAIGTLASWVSGIIVSISEFLRSDSEMTDLRRYYDAADRSNTGKGIPLPDKSSMPPGITLKNVSYSYPNSERPALRDINIEIKPGERIAVVGENGAGKTTLVKLLCGLYLPTRGEIFLNGLNILKFNRDEYFTMFSTVFQDIHFTTTGIIGNISSTTPELTDKTKLEKCLRLSGLYEKVQSLPEKEYTGILRETDEKAIELSGGEKQKIALARALYKDAPVIILDEPTAALDPIAESEVYQKFAKLTEGKTSVYISHRLASTRFCDRILFIDGQTVAEQGTHDELMRLGGRYAYMFGIQASYYSSAKGGSDCE